MEGKKVDTTGGGDEDTITTTTIKPENSSGSANKPENSSQQPGPGDQINIRVLSQDGTEMTFRLKRSTKLKKLMESYCAREGKNIKHCKFTFDGERIREDHTPEELDMQQDDKIDVWTEQIGGCLY